jgi:hypothetical protein
MWRRTSRFFFKHAKDIFIDRPMAEAKKDLTCHIVVCQDAIRCQVDGPGTTTSFHCGRVISPVTRLFFMLPVSMPVGSAGRIFIISRVGSLAFILTLSKARMQTHNL